MEEIQLTSWGWYFTPVFTKVFSTIQTVVFSPDFWTINSINNESFDLRFKPFVLILEEEVRSQAKESDRRFRSKNPRSIFEGVPVTWLLPSWRKRYRIKASMWLYTDIRKKKPNDIF